MGTPKDDFETEGVNFQLTEPISDDENSQSTTETSNGKSPSADLKKSDLRFRRSLPFWEDVELKFIPRRNRLTVSRLNDGNDQWDANELDAKEEHILVLHDHNFKHSLMERLNTFRRNRELCDVVLFVREHEIHAHKVVLASISNALFDMFLKETDEVVSNSNSQSNGTNSLSEDVQPKKGQLSSGVITSDKRFSNYFEFAQGDYECFEAIVNFAYTFKLQISSWKVAELYKTAYCLQVIPIAKACARYLAENLSVNNCIGIRKQANFNNDDFLVGKVDSFITENIEHIISESVEFTQLSCIKVRIITDSAGNDLDDGYNLAEKTLNYFKQYQKLSERIDQQIDALVEKPHLLFVSDDTQPLQNLCDADDTSSVGSCEIVQDYKRCGQTSKTAGHNNNPIGAQPIQHRITGAKAVKMNASRVTNAKFASNESLNSLASSTSTTDDEIESRLIAVFNNSPNFWITIAVLHRRIVVFSIQCSENVDVVRSIAKNGGEVFLKNIDLISGRLNETLTLNNFVSKLVDSNTPTPVSFDVHMQLDLTPTLNGNAIGVGNGHLTDNISASSNPLLQRRIMLPSVGRARCSNGATFVNGRIIICGGYDRGECLKSVEELDVTKEDKWRSLPDMLDARGRFDSAVEAGKVYAIAGSNGNNDLKTCERYDPKLQTWMPIKSLAKARSHNGCATLNGLIYCIGGSSDHIVLEACERYDPKTDKWSPIAPLQTPRFQAGCTNWRGLIVFCAGCDRWNCLDTVEAYDPRTDTWRYLAKLKTPRRGCAVAVFRDALYVIGGHDGTQSLRSVEVLDYPNAHSWRPGASLNVARANTHATVTARNAIYVVGGFDGTQFLDSMEVFENESVGWRSWQQQPDQSAIPEEDDEIMNDENVDFKLENSDLQHNKVVLTAAQ